MSGWLDEPAPELVQPEQTTNNGEADHSLWDLVRTKPMSEADIMAAMERNN